MPKCTHRNANLIEHLDAVSVWEFVDGKLVFDGTNDASLNGAVTVECRDCNKTFRYGRNARVPEWVSKMQDAVTDRYEVTPTP